MNQEFASLHKMLKDKTRQKIVLLLNEKGHLIDTELMEHLDLHFIGLLNIHLRTRIL